MGNESQNLFEIFCKMNGIKCLPIPTGPRRTPDYSVLLQGIEVICEVKQINANRGDEKEVDDVANRGNSVRFIPNRIKNVLKKVSGQLKESSINGHPTLVVVYDNTPFKHHGSYSEVVQAMFGALTTDVYVSKGPDRSDAISIPYYGGERRVGPRHNTSLSAIAILRHIGSDGGALLLEAYTNPYAAVPLDPCCFVGLPVKVMPLPSVLGPDRGHHLADPDQ